MIAAIMGTGALLVAAFGGNPLPFLILAIIVFGVSSRDAWTTR